MKLYAISDLHVAFERNRQLVSEISSSKYKNDWLLLPGDIGEKDEDFRFVFDELTKKFAKIFWTPGNHDLWTMPGDPNPVYGEKKYFHLVDLCRKYGVITPEDDFVQWPAGEEKIYIIPVFTLYDYSFRPDDVSLEGAIPWAMEDGIRARDEDLWSNEPYSSKVEWCQKRVRYSEERLDQLPQDAQMVVLSHFPLVEEPTKRMRRIPRFTIWCGTKLTSQWYKKYPIKVMVHGHLHIPLSDYWDGVRSEEVSLGYPRQWDQSREADSFLRLILE